MVSSILGGNLGAGAGFCAKLEYSLSLSLDDALSLLRKLSVTSASFFGFWTSATCDLPSNWLFSGGCCTRGLE